MKMFIPSNERLQQIMHESRGKALREQDMEDPNARFNSSTISKSLNEMKCLESSFSSKTSGGTPMFKRSGVSIFID